MCRGKNLLHISLRGHYEIVVNLLFKSVTKIIKNLSRILQKNSGEGIIKKTLKTETVYAFKRRFYCL